MKRTTATGSVSGKYVDRNTGTGTAGTLLIAEDRNNIQEELCNAIEDAGITLNGSDQNQLEKAIIALSKPVGELFFSMISKETSETFPAVEIGTADQELDAENYPSLVPALRAQKLDVGGATSFTATVSGSVLTFASGVIHSALLSMMVEDAIVNGNGEEDYTSWRCVTIGGSDYAITAIDTSAMTITVDGTPASGTQTVTVYPFRIAGESSQARIYKNSGRALFAQDDDIFGNGLRQPEGLPNITGTIKYDDFSQTDPTGAFEIQQGGYYGGADTGNIRNRLVKFDASKSNGIYGNSEHVTPNATGAYLYMWAGVYNE